MDTHKNKSPECDTPNCLICKFWPTASAMFHPQAAEFWVDKETAEVFVATGLKALSTGEVVEMEERLFTYVKAVCDCGNEAVMRADILTNGYSDRCPVCAALSAEAASN
jgi:hypothetical protein